MMMHCFEVNSDENVWSDSQVLQIKNSPNPVKRKPDKRRHSYLAAINNAIILPDTDSPLAYCLPKELWLTILVNYGLSATDLANLELACKWLNVCWEGTYYVMMNKCDQVL